MGVIDGSIYLKVRAGVSIGPSPVEVFRDIEGHDAAAIRFHRHGHPFQARLH
eukprot:SAG22_NODE_18283_length_290_cov_0.544503_1_plen_51_part_10